MEAPFKKGAQVRQRVVVIEGEVKDITFDADTGAFKYQVDYTDADGEAHSRWFQHGELEAKEAAQ